MSNLENLSPAADDEQKSASPGVMLTTILLLIGGLLLSSTLLLYNALERKTGEAPKLKTLIEQPKSQVAGPQETEAPVEIEAEATKVDIKKILSVGSAEKEVKWPRLKLTGFGSSAEGGFAIINGGQVFLHENIGAVKLVEVRAHSVIVECMGERKTLTVGIKK